MEKQSDFGYSYSFGSVSVHNFPCLLSKSEQSPTYVLLVLEFVFQSKAYQNIVLYANFLTVNPLLYVIRGHQAVYM